MSDAKNYLAFDFGASSGRAILGKLNNGRLELEEIHRFSNDPVEINGHYYWDTFRLFYEIKQGLIKYAQGDYGVLDGIGIDAWGVDFGLIGPSGELLGVPYHYRDARTQGRKRTSLWGAGKFSTRAAFLMSFLIRLISFWLW